VVIGRRARNISEADALDHVLGYTVTNDVTSFSALSEDGVQSLSLRFKLYDTFLPIGPRIVCDIDVSDRRLTARLNGEIKQDVSTADMSFQVAETVAWASSVMTLNAGDIISMGTPPGFCDMREGDVVECEIEGVGVLRNRVRRGL
jgi:2-keto-4-pentenoate hydratase/2-oxohepta-3-ene-1,7-dioic acid hydratase in catechol pathway